MTKTMAERIKQHGLTLTVLDGPILGREWSPGGKTWEHYAFRVRLTTADGRTLDTPWRQGTGVGTKTPDLADVLDSLALDAAGWQNAEDALDFASEYGYDLSTSEERNHVRTLYAACGQVHADLTDLLGDEGRDALLFDTERE